MGQIIVRNLDDQVIARLKAKAKAENISLEQKVRDIIASADEDKNEVFAEIEEIHQRVGPVTLDSVALIREDRDNDDPYR